MLRALLRRLARPLLAIAAMAIAAMVFLPKLIAGIANKKGADDGTSPLSTSDYFTKMKENREEFIQNNRANRRAARREMRALRKAHRRGQISDEDFVANREELLNRRDLTYNRINREYQAGSASLSRRYIGQAAPGAAASGVATGAASAEAAEAVEHQGKSVGTSKSVADAPEASVSEKDSVAKDSGEEVGKSSGARVSGGPGTSSAPKAAPVVQPASPDLSKMGRADLIAHSSRKFVEDKNASNLAKCSRIDVVQGKMQNGEWNGSGPTTFYCEDTKGASGAIRRYYMDHGYSRQDFNKAMANDKSIIIRPMSEKPFGVPVSGSLYLGADGKTGVAKVFEVGEMMDRQGKSSSVSAFQDFRARAEVSLKAMAGRGGVPQAAAGVPSGLVARCDTKDAINIYDGRTRLATVRMDPTSESGLRSDLTEAGKNYRMSDGRSLSEVFPADGNVSGLGKGLGDVFAQMTGPANMQQIQQGVDMQRQREADLQQDSQAAQNYLSQAGAPTQGPSLAGGLAG